MKSILLASLVLFTSLGVYSCSKKEVGTNVQGIKKEYSGEELFRGIFFLDGEVAEKISSYQEVLKNDQFRENLQNSTSVLFQQEITDALRKENPLVFEKLKTSIMTKDRYEVIAQIKNINAKINAVMQNKAVAEKINLSSSRDITKLKEGGSILENADMNRIDNRCGAAVFCVAYAAALVHNAVFITTFGIAAIAGAIWGGVYLWEATYSRDSQIQGGSNFQLESFIEEIMNSVH